MTDYNVRDVFFLLTGRCGHKWVADGPWDACPTCGDQGMPRAGKYEHVIAEEPIAVNFRYTGVLRKVERRIQRAIRANRHKKRKTLPSFRLLHTGPGHHHQGHEHARWGGQGYAR